MEVIYGLNKMVNLRATYFLNQENISPGNANDYNRQMLDIQFRCE